MSDDALDLAVVIPTRGRRDALDRTLDALEVQSVTGFEVIVVLDGLDEPPLDRAGLQVVRVSHRGPGAARNAGVGATERSVILFLGADMVPDRDLVARHLARHREEPAEEVALLGRVRWHADVAGSSANRWLDRSGSQFDYDALDRAGPDGRSDAGFGRFYSCNVSMKRALFEAVGGFDPEFVYYYEDLDMGWRLAQRGMVLRYDPQALVHHLHLYDWDGVRRRFEGIAVGERLMAEKHEWFTPFYRSRILAHARLPEVSGLWAELADHAPVERLGAIGRRISSRANRYHHQRLALPFLEAWDRHRDLAELQAYLGPRYDHTRLVNHVREVESEEHAAPDEVTFYRTSRAYLYDLTVFAMSGTKDPYRQVIRRLVPPGARLLDYGCGIGADGLRFAEEGYRLSFADYSSPSTDFLRWRLGARGLEAEVYDVERAVPGGHDLVYCFDVVEHVEDPFAILDQLEALGETIVVNFLEPAPGDTHVHKMLDIPALLDHVAARGLVFYERFHGRSHLVAYRPSSRGAAARARSSTWRRVGGRHRSAAALSKAESAARRLRPSANGQHRGTPP